MASQRTYHLTMADPTHGVVYHLQCDSVAQALEIAQGHRGPEALSITDSTRQCYACRTYGNQQPLTLHQHPHEYGEKKA